MIKVLIVDDSALMRKNLRRLLERERDIVVVGAARDGEDAIIKYAETEPDVVTLDINMPKMDGLTTLQHILTADPNAKVIMLSSLTHEGAMVTFEALALGALDFVGKPGGTVSADLATITQELIGKIKMAARVRSGSRSSGSHYKAIKERQTSTVRKARVTGKRIVVIGISTGGPKTLLEVVPKLPATLQAPVLIVQHMPANFTTGFAQRLDSFSPLRIKEAAAGDILQPGCAYLAPGGQHMVLTPMADGSGHRIRITSSPADSLYKPSVDVTMDSVFQCFGSRMVGVIMTGMGADGANAMERLHKAGGATIAESEKTSIVFGMPREVIELGAADLILPSYEIGDAITRIVGA